MRPRFCALIKPRDQGGTQLNTDKVLSTTIKKKKKKSILSGRLGRLVSWVQVGILRKDSPGILFIQSLMSRLAEGSNGS